MHVVIGCQIYCNCLKKHCIAHVTYPYLFLLHKYMYIGLFEQALGWLPLGLELVVVDEPSDTFMQLMMKASLLDNFTW